MRLTCVVILGLLCRALFKKRGVKDVCVKE